MGRRGFSLTVVAAVTLGCCLASAGQARAQGNEVVAGSTGNQVDLRVAARDGEAFGGSLVVSLASASLATNVTVFETDGTNAAVRQFTISFDVPASARPGAIGTLEFDLSSAGVLQFDASALRFAFRVVASDRELTDDVPTDVDVEYVAPTLVLTKIARPGGVESRPDELGFWEASRDDDLAVALQRSLKLEAPARIKLDEPFSVRGEVREDVLYGDGYECGRQRAPIRAALQVELTSAQATSRRSLGADCPDVVRGELRLQDSVPVALSFDPVEVTYRNLTERMWVEYRYTSEAAGGEREGGAPDIHGRINYFSGEDGKPRFDLPDPASRSSDDLEVRFHGLVLTYEPESPGRRAVDPRPYAHPPPPESFPPRPDVETLVAVPSLFGLTPAEAQRRVDEWGLLRLVTVLGEPASSEATTGLISSSEPPTGRMVARGSIVTAFVAGPYVEMRTMPYVLGSSLPRARSSIGSDLMVSVHVVKARVAGEANTVVAQSIPEGSRVPAGSAVELSVAGPWIDLRRVPLLVGLSPSEARARVSEARLSSDVQVVNAASADDSGRVVAQSLPEGAEVERGATISLSVAGPYLREVPALVGATLADARTWLTDAGLMPAVKVVPAPNAASAALVLAQSVAPGTRLAPGSEVGIDLAGPWVVAATPAAVPIPAPDLPEAIRQPASQSPAACGHPWQVERVTRIAGLDITVCECRYGRGINSQSCLPPIPPGHLGCAPGTGMQLERASGLGAGCDCLFGSENGVCRLPPE